jgi:hypothetical protein
MLTLTAQPSFNGGYLGVSIAADSPYALTVQATAITYAQGEGPAPGTLTIYWGDGTQSEALRVQDVLLENEVRQITYLTEHTYPARATYVLTADICCLDEQIANITNPATEPLHLQTTYTFTDPIFQGGIARTPTLVEPGYGVAFIESPYVYNPNAFDPDNDSLAYFLYLEELGYELPSTSDPSGAATFAIDENTGTIEWDQPSEPNQKYLTPMLIVGFRFGFPLDTLLFTTTIETRGLTSGQTTPLSKLPVQVYPNPGNGWLTIRGIRGRADARLYNLQGQLLRSWQNLQDNEQISIMLPAGAYQLKIKDEAGLQVLPVVIH